MRSARPASCARLGRFMLTRYFSIISPSCFCAPAAAPPAWFITLENSGEAIAWLAKELNPFSISAIIVCQTTAGSLPFSAIGALSLSVTSVCHASPVIGPYHTVAEHRSTRAKPFCAAANRGIELDKTCAASRGNHVTAIVYQPPQTIRVNGIDICYDIFGDANAEPLLWSMGLGAQMIVWDDEFCEKLAARGYRVIRFDNRDIGKSGRLTGGGPLRPLELLKLRFLKIALAAPY